MKYCENCEEYVDVEHGKCVVCGAKLIINHKEPNLDNWNLFDDSDEDYLDEFN